MTQHRFTSAPTSCISLRLMLALLLALSPLWSFAGMPTAAADDKVAAGGMPCHAGAGHHGDALKSGSDSACPHCDGGGAAVQCQCAHFTVPAGAPPAVVTTDIATFLTAVSSEPVTEPIPDSPRNRLYRPPIVAI